MKTKFKNAIRNFLPKYPDGDMYEREVFKIIVDLEYLMRFSDLPITKKRKLVIPLIDEYFEFQKGGDKQFLTSIKKRNESWITSAPCDENYAAEFDDVFFNGKAIPHSNFIIDAQNKVLKKIGTIFFETDIDYAGKSMRAALEKLLEEYFLLLN
jgi:hypothetical protein